MYAKKSIIMPLLLGASNVKSFPLWVSSYLLLVTQSGAMGTLCRSTWNPPTAWQHIPLHTHTSLALNSSWVSSSLLVALIVLLSTNNSSVIVTTSKTEKTQQRVQPHSTSPLLKESPPTKNRFSEQLHDEDKFHQQTAWVKMSLFPQT